MRLLRFLSAWIRYKINRARQVNEHPLIQDLLENDRHDFCIVCDELFFKAHKKDRFCCVMCEREFFYKDK
jgi:hypothetical protein